jgi:hypothetical protein
MAGNTPEIGLVIRHLYLWRDEQRQGREDGRKARPCLIVHKRQNEYDETEVFICPITHTPPKDFVQAKEIPFATKQRLKLDDDQSWIITSEANRFTWQGPDLRKTQAGEFAYGYLPHGLIKAVIDQVQVNSRQRNLEIVDRDDEVLNKQIRELKRKTQTKSD